MAATARLVEDVLVVLGEQRHAASHVHRQVGHGLVDIAPHHVFTADRRDRARQVDTALESGMLQRRRLIAIGVGVQVDLCESVRLSHRQVDGGVRESGLRHERQQAHGERGKKGFETHC